MASSVTKLLLHLKGEASATWVPPVRHTYGDRRWNLGARGGPAGEQRGREHAALNPDKAGELGRQQLGGLRLLCFPLPVKALNATSAAALCG